MTPAARAHARRNHGMIRPGACAVAVGGLVGFALGAPACAVWASPTHVQLSEYSTVSTLNIDDPQLPAPEDPIDPPVVEPPTEEPPVEEPPAEEPPVEEPPVEEPPIEEPPIEEPPVEEPPIEEPPAPAPEDPAALVAPSPTSAGPEAQSWSVFRTGGTPVVVQSPAPEAAPPVTPGTTVVARTPAWAAGKTPVQHPWTQASASLHQAEFPYWALAYGVGLAGLSGLVALIAAAFEQRRYPRGF
jgi:outer membrane biosynthesis protein TonB